MSDSTTHDCPDEARDEFAVVVIGEDEPEVVAPEPEQQAAEISECRYCGLCPCGCGG